MKPGWNTETLYGIPKPILYAHWQSEEYSKRVRELEEEGLDTSDAQGCADAEFITQYRKEQS